MSKWLWLLLGGTIGGFIAYTLTFLPLFSNPPVTIPVSSEGLSVPELSQCGGGKDQEAAIIRVVLDQPAASDKTVNVSLLGVTDPNGDPYGGSTVADFPKSVVIPAGRRSVTFRVKIDVAENTQINLKAQFQMSMVEGPGLVRVAHDVTVWAPFLSFW